MTKEEFKERIAERQFNLFDENAKRFAWHEISASKKYLYRRKADSIISIFKELVESVENPNFTQSMFSGSKHSGFEQFRQSLLSILGE